MFQFAVMTGVMLQDTIKKKNFLYVYIKKCDIHILVLQ